LKIRTRSEFITQPHGLRKRILGNIFSRHWNFCRSPSQKKKKKKDLVKLLCGCLSTDLKETVYDGLPYRKNCFQSQTSGIVLECPRIIPNIVRDILYIIFRCIPVPHIISRYIPLRCLPKQWYPVFTHTYTCTYVQHGQWRSRNYGENGNIPSILFRIFFYEN